MQFLLKFLAVMVLTANTSLMWSMEPPTKIVRQNATVGTTPAILKDLAAEVVLKNAASYNPKDLIDYYSYLSGVPGLKNIYKKTLYRATASHAEEVMKQNLYGINNLQEALLEPLSETLASEEKTISALISIKIACNALMRTVKDWGKIHNFNRSSLIDVLRATQKLIPVNESHFFSKTGDTLYEFKKIDDSFIRTGNRKCNDVSFANNNLLVKNKLNHLIHFTKNQGRFLGKNNAHQDIDLVGKNGHHALIDEDKAIVTINKHTLKIYQQDDTQPEIYVLVDTFDFDTTLAINTLLVRENVIIVTTNQKIWLFRWKDGDLRLEHEYGDNSIIESNIQASGTGDLITHSHSYYAGHNIAHRTVVYRYEDDQWYENELTAYSMHQAEPFPIKAATIQSDNVLIGYVEMSTRIVPVCFSWVNQFWLYEGLLSHFDFATTQGHEKLVTTNQDNSLSTISRRLLFHWEQAQISDDKIREYNISKDGNRIIGITEDQRVLLLEYRDNQWHRAYSTETVNINDYQNIPVIPQGNNTLQTKETLEAILKLDPECIFESINTIIFLKSGNTRYIFQHNRNTNELDLVYKCNDDNLIDLSVLKEAFSSGIILENNIFDEITRVVLTQLQHYRTEAQRALQHMQHN